MKAASQKSSKDPLSKPTTRIGVLQQDSPGLDRSLSQILVPAELAQVRETYAVAAKLGALDETPILRHPQASFNPKPARICQILMEELRETRCQAFQSALLACVTEARHGELPPEYQEELVIAQEAHTLTLTPTAAKRSVISERIFLALTLDLLRHLHMTSLPPEEKHKLYETTKNLTIPAIAHPENERLKKMLTSRISLIERLQKEA